MSEALLSENEVAEEVAGLSSTDLGSLKLQALNNLYVMAKGVLGYPDVNVDTHGAFCDFIVNPPTDRTLEMMPRSHLKSTLDTIADPLRLVLKNPEHARVLIVSETATQAEKFLKEIKGHCQEGKILRQLFPELIPTRFSGQGIDWSTRQATLLRKAPHKESHWTTLGVGGASVGSHYTRIKCDDLIGLEAMKSPAKMQETIQYVDNIEPLLVDQHTDIINFCGTRWSRNDLYQHLMSSYGQRLSVFLRSAIENGKIIFPQKHTWQEYEFLQTNRPTVWYSQYCNNPIAGGKADFPVGNVGFFTFSADGAEVVFKRDGMEKRWRIEFLDRVITCDPNSGSKMAENLAAIVVSGISPDDEVFTLDISAARFSASELVDEIFRLGVRWRPRVIGIEKAGQQNTDHYLRMKMEKDREYFNVQPLSPKNQHKEDRIRFFMEPIIRSGLLFTLASQTALRDQIATFPDCNLWDELDTLAYGPEVWRKPHRVEDMESNQRAMKILMKRRARRTGY